MLLLLVSIAMLWISPWLYGLIQNYPTILRWTQRALVVLISLLVLVVILPESIRLVGWGAVFVVALGMLLPSLVERVWHKLAVTVHWVPLAIGLFGLALHASLDGAAFVDPEHHSHTHMHALPVAVVVHRFFEGLFIWLFLRPRFGWKISATALGLISTFSLFGYWAGDFYFHSIEEAAPFGLFQALVGGSLLHLVIDQHDPGSEALAHEHGHSHDHGHGHHH